MTDPFLWVKWLHIVSATVLFGTGAGTAFHMYATHLRGNREAIAVAARNTVLADWLFTAPAGVLQPVTGFALIYMAGYDPIASWLVVVYGLYTMVALCWFRVVYLQNRARDLAEAAVAADCDLPPEYFAAMRQWFILGWPGFLGLIGVFVLMVFRPDF